MIKRRFGNIVVLIGPFEILGRRFVGTSFSSFHHQFSIEWYFWSNSWFVLSKWPKIWKTSGTHWPTSFSFGLLIFKFHFLVLILIFKEFQDFQFFL